MDSPIKKWAVNCDEKLIEQFYSLSKRIQNLANSNILRIDYLREISKMMVDFTGCDSIELWLNENSTYIHCEIARTTEYSFHYEIIQAILNKNGELVNFNKEKSILDFIRVCVINRRFDSSLTAFTPYGSFWTDDTAKSAAFILNEEEKQYYQNTAIKNNHESLALIPLIARDKNIGLLQLLSSKKNYFNEKFIELFEGLAPVLGSALLTQRTQAALRERVKELSCLYNIAQVVGQHGISREEILTSIVKFLPSAWQYPEIAVGRIVLDGNIYSTSNLQKGWQKLTANIFVKNQQRGVVEVFYTKIKPQLDEGPFLWEERNLLNVIARQLALIIETKEAEEEKLAVQQQLMHADRLATLGQLAAGIAHELNEPLGNILGFAQLIKKNTDLTPLTIGDAEKIINATLYARDIIKKLLLFAREMPPKVDKINLNKIVEDGLFFFEARCLKSGIELIRHLSPQNPEIFGDQSQLSQSLINLVVNSMQAMPDGGELTIETNIDDDHVSLVVTDTGIGMSEEVKRKIFVPFFTTKDIDEGTGLGLSVVHGIITSHKGTIHVESEVGVGTRFEIRLPRFFHNR